MNAGLRPLEFPLSGVVGVNIRLVMGPADGPKMGESSALGMSKECSRSVKFPILTVVGVEHGIEGVINSKL